MIALIHSLTSIAILSMFIAWMRSERWVEGLLIHLVGGLADPLATGRHVRETKEIKGTVLARPPDCFVW